MKEISQRLGREGWAIIDLTLNQFRLPTSEMFGGTPDMYVLKMIEQASDETLVELATHLGFDPGFPVGHAIDPSFWQAGMFRLFISHLATRKKSAAELRDALRYYGISAFVAHDDIEPTSEWQGEIELALSTCDSLIALMHERFHESNWTDQEIGFAMGRGVPVFAVRLGADPYGFVGRFQAFDGHGAWPGELAQDLFEAYRKNKQTKRKMALALVTMFVDSNSFQEARIRVRHLEELDYWEAPFSDRILAASKANRQITDSTGVVDRVHNVIEKWAGRNSRN